MEKHIAHRGAHAGSWCTLGIRFTGWPESAGVPSSWLNARLVGWPAPSCTETWGEPRQRKIHFLMTVYICFCIWLGAWQDQRFACVFEKFVPHPSPLSNYQLLTELYSAFWLLILNTFPRSTSHHSTTSCNSDQASFRLRSFYLQKKYNGFSWTLKDFRSACEALTTLFTQTTTRLFDFSCLDRLARLPLAMFCFCFQSPSLKLQALEAESGPSPAQVETQVGDSSPSQQQPLSTEQQSLYLSHKLLLHLPPSPPAQENHTVDSSQPGKLIIMMSWYNEMKMVSTVFVLLCGTKRKVV